LSFSSSLLKELLMAAVAGKSALLVGATGASGARLLVELLNSPHFTRVGEYGRRLTALDTLPANAKDKLVQKTVDFDKLLADTTDDQGLKEGKWDVVFITLGTTRATAGSAAAFEKIDRDYVVAAARAAKVADSEHTQRLVYLSSAGANHKSMFLYPRSKGLTERALASLGYSDTLVARPGLLLRGDSARMVEKIFGASISAASLIMPSIARNAQMPVSVLAKGLATLGRLGSSALPAEAHAEAASGESESDKYTIVGNAGLYALAEQS
jgi:oxidoreductase